MAGGSDPGSRSPAGSRQTSPVPGDCLARAAAHHHRQHQLLLVLLHVLLQTHPQLPQGLTPPPSVVSDEAAAYSCFLILIASNLSGIKDFYLSSLKALNFSLSAGSSFSAFPTSRTVARTNWSGQ